MSMRKWLDMIREAGKTFLDSPASAESRKPADPVNTERRLKNDFRETIRFEGYEKAQEGEDPRLVLGEKTAELPKAFRGGDAVLYRMENGKTAVGFFLDIPTFDSGDRQYDSWHALYLWAGELPGSVDGAYCGGGYDLAYGIWCRDLLEAPGSLWKLLKEWGILRGKKEKKRKRSRGEKFRVRLPETEGILWMQRDDTGRYLLVLSYEGQAEMLTIPDKVEGLAVMSIDDRAFSGNSSLCRIRLPETLQTIGERAFAGCRMLEEIHLPKNLETMECRAFEGCRNLKSVRLPGSLKKLGMGYRQGGMFAGCTSLMAIEADPGCRVCRVSDGVLFSPDGIELWQYPAGRREEEYSIPEGTERIIGDAFSYNRYLKRVGFPGTMAEIYPFAFRNCQSLEEIRLPGGLYGLNKHSFEDCASLREVWIPDHIWKLDLTVFTGCPLEKIHVSAENHHFVQKEGLLFDESKTELRFFPRRGRTFCRIPKEVQCIGDYAFAGCEDLREIHLPEGLEKIGEGAFKSCRSLEKIHFPGSIKEIGEEAFCQCVSLKKVVLPEGMREFGKGAFMMCESLQTALLPKSLKKISRYGFAGCKSLTKIDLPEGLSCIGCNAFSGCGLKEMVLPRSISYMEETIFGMGPTPHMMYRGNQEDWIRKADVDDDAFAGGVEFLK